MNKIFFHVLWIEKKAAEEKNQNQCSIKNKLQGHIVNQKSIFLHNIQEMLQ